MSTVYKPITTRIDTTANWTTLNPTPRYGEQCIEILGGGLFKLKIGDGVTPWISLNYYQSTIEGGIGDLITPDKQTLVAAINSVQKQVTDIVEHTSQRPELRATRWDENKRQRVKVPGVTEDNAVFICPAPESAGDYATFGIMCVEQDIDGLIFTCSSVPDVNIIVNVFLL